MTLKVYLDTQDYINLFNEPNDGPNHQILARLIQHRDRGEIVIGFSFATILEFITKPDTANRPERVRRGELIKEICGSNAFPHPMHLKDGATFPNGGMWMFPAGHKVVTAKWFKAQMHKAVVEQLATTEGVNRATKRRLGRKASMTDIAREIGSSWGKKRSDWGDFPVSNELMKSGVLVRFMKGQCGAREFEAAMNAWISDPAEYSRIIYDYANHPNAIDKYFGAAHDKLEAAVNNIQRAVESIQILNAKILDARKNLIEAGVDKVEARKITKQISLPERPLEDFDANLEGVLGPERAGHFQHYLARVIKPGYRFKRSDAMDLMQFCYAYECDLFRCDKDMANTMRSYEPFNGKLVSRFSDLPHRISAKISAIPVEKQQPH